MATYRRRGRPPKNADEYLLNVESSMQMLKRRRELAAEIEKLTAEGERELLRAPARKAKKAYETDKPAAR